MKRICITRIVACVFVAGPLILGCGGPLAAEEKPNESLIQMIAELVSDSDRDMRHWGSSRSASKHRRSGHEEVRRAAAQTWAGRPGRAVGGAGQRRLRRLRACASPRRAATTRSAAPRPWRSGCLGDKAASLVGTAGRHGLGGGKEGGARASFVCGARRSTRPSKTRWPPARPRSASTLDLYANLRPVSNLPGVPSRFEDVDLVIVRENTEDLYAGLEHEVVPGVVESLKIITERASTRIASFAFAYARRHGRKKVTAIHKANIMKLERRAVPRDAAAPVAARVPRHQVRRADRRRGVHAPGDEPGAVRRAACCRTCTATSCRICAPAWWAGSASVGAANLGDDIARVRGGARHARPTSPARTSRTRRRCCCRRVLMLRHIDEADAADRDHARAGRRCSRPARSARAISAAPRSTPEFADAVCRAIEAVLKALRYQGRPGSRARHVGRSSRGIVAIVQAGSPRRCSRARTSAAAEWRQTASSRTRASGSTRYLDELRTTQRYPIYRALQHPLYPILRKIERMPSTLHHVTGRRARPRVVYASNHRATSTIWSSRSSLDDNGVRPPLIAAGINLFGGPLGLIHRHVTGAIPIRRNTKDPAYLDHAEGVRRRGPPEARPVLLPRGRTQLQRRAEAGEDRAASRGAATPGAPTWSSCRWRSRTTWCSRTTSSRASGSRSAQRPFARELAEMVRYAVGYRSRAFVTFGAPIPVADCDPHSRRDVLELTRLVREPHRRAVQGAADGDLRGGHAPVDHAARARDRASTASSRSSRRADANLGVTSGRQAVDEAAEPLETRGIVVLERGRFRVRERHVAALLRPHHRAPARHHAAGPTDARQRFEERSSTCSPAARPSRRSRRATACASRRASRAGSSPARRSTRPSPPRARSSRAALTLTLDHLGESVANLAGGATPPRATYLRIIDADRARGHRTQRLAQADAARARPRQGERRSTTCGASSIAPSRHGFFVRIDMENSPYIDVTLDIFETLWNAGLPQRRRRPAVGARPQRGGLRRVNALGARVRLVKGAYKEPRGRRVPEEGRGRRRVRAHDRGAARRGPLSRPSPRTTRR